jgi:hypothetical protein
MNAFGLLRKGIVCATAAGLCLAGVMVASAPLPAQGPNPDQDQEVQIGQEVFNELKAKDEIIESSPLYDVLRPIADSITRAAQPRYNHPFKFYLVHETQPNAFATLTSGIHPAPTRRRTSRPPKIIAEPSSLFFSEVRKFMMGSARNFSCIHLF